MKKLAYPLLFVVAISLGLLSSGLRARWDEQKRVADSRLYEDLYEASMERTRPQREAEDLRRRLEVREVEEQAIELTKKTVKMLEERFPQALGER